MLVVDHVSYFVSGCMHCIGLYACVWPRRICTVFCGQNICNSVDDIVFVGLTMVQVAREDLRTNVPSGVRCPEDHFLGYQWVPFPTPL